VRSTFGVTVTRTALDIWEVYAPGAYSDMAVLLQSYKGQVAPTNYYHLPFHMTIHFK
jgi:hypothetical protein